PRSSTMSTSSWCLIRPAGMTRARSAFRPTSRSWPCRPIRLNSIPSSACGSTSRSASSRTGCMTTTRLSSMPPARLGGASPRRPVASNRSAPTLDPQGQDLGSMVSAVPDFVGHRQACPGGGIDRPVGQDLKFILKDPHQLTCVLASVPGGSLQKFVPANVAIVDVGATAPIGSCLGGLPPRRKSLANIAAVRQNLLARRTGRGHPIVRRCLQWNALFMLEEGIDNVEKVPGKLRIGTRATRQLVVQVVLGNLSEEA